MSAIHYLFIKDSVCKINKLKLSCQNNGNLTASTKVCSCNYAVEKLYKSIYKLSGLNGKPKQVHTKTPNVFVCNSYVYENACRIHKLKPSCLNNGDVTALT